MKRTMIIIIAFLLFIPLKIYGYECDENIKESVPLSRFKINTVLGEAHDTKSKLTWKICVEGTKFDGNKCLGTPTEFKWPDEVSQYSKFSSESDWRLPSVEEFRSIIEPRCKRPAFNLKIFPNAPRAYLWTSDAYSPSEPLIIHSIDGTEGLAGVGYYADIRLVRGDKWIDYERIENEKKAEEAAAKEAKKRALAEEKRNASAAKKRADEYKNKTYLFRKTIAPGDECTYGMIIEVKKPLAKVQTTQYVVNHYTEWKTKYNQYGSYKDPEVATQSSTIPVEKWFKISDLYPVE